MERSNISIKFVETFISARAGMWFDAVAAALVETVMLLMAWEFFVFAGKLAKAGETTWVLKIATAPFWYGVDAILWCAVLVQAIVVALETARCFGREPTVRQAGR